LQHPLADSLLKMGEGSVQWRTYHFQRLVDVYTTLEMRNRFGDDQNLDVDQVFDAIRDVTAEIHESAKDEIFEILYDDKYDIASIVVR